MQMTRKTQNLFRAALLAAPITLFAFSGTNPNNPGPPIMRTGAAVDGGINCVACHSTFAPANSQPGGFLRILAAPYRPGEKQIVRVTISHPEATRWGFQLIARRASDETQQAGTFAISDSVNVRCAPAGAFGPCTGGVLEFAIHKVAATAIGGVGGAKTYEVEWTPPATGVGDVIFYAAGNAANGNSNNQGDRVYTASERVAADIPCTGTARPTIAGVASAAPFSASFSGNSLVTISGTNFVPAGAFREAVAAEVAGGRFPSELGCIAVEIAGRRTPVLFAGDVGGGRHQINVQAPTVSSAGPVEVRVILRGSTGELRSDAFNATTALHAPAFFLFSDATGVRSVAARHSDFSILADPAVVPGARPTAPNAVVLLYGTGFGFTNPVFQSGEITQGQAPLTDQVTVTIGGVTLAASDILYAGLTPDSISGLYQFNVRIPAAVADGNVPVSIRVGGVSTPATGAVIPVRR